MTMLRLSKQQLAGKLAKKTLIFDEKMKSFWILLKKIQNLDVGNQQIFQDGKDSCSKFPKE